MLIVCLFIFFILQNVDDSKVFFKRKIEFLTKQIEKIQPALQEKHAMKQGENILNKYIVLSQNYIHMCNIHKGNGKS